MRASLRASAGRPTGKHRLHCTSIDPAVRNLPDVFLADMDDLRTTADGHLQARREELMRCETIIRERAAQLLARLAGGWPLGAHHSLPN